MPKGSSKSGSNPAQPKTALIAHIADKTELSRKQVDAVFEAFYEFTVSELKKGNAVLIPYMAKVVRKLKPARAAHMGINPATKEKIMIKAAPAKYVVKVRPLKSIKTAVLK